MGQKVKPTGFRLGITEDWRSRWYAGNDYAATLENDLKLRKYVEKKLSNAALSRVEIERAGRQDQGHHHDRPPWHRYRQEGRRG